MGVVACEVRADDVARDDSGLLFAGAGALQKPVGDGP